MLIEDKGFRLQADLGAEKMFAAEKKEQRIVVEVQVFGTPSFVNELQKAVGQYLMYRTFLKHTAPEHDLFLALPQSVFEDFFQQDAITEIVDEHQLQLLVFDPTTEEVIALCITRPIPHLKSDCYISQPPSLATSLLGGDGPREDLLEGTLP